MTGPHDLSYLLERLIEAVPDSRSALLLSDDGLVKYWHALTREEAETLAAIAASLQSGSRQVGARFFPEGTSVRQVACELAGGILLVAAAGVNTALAVLAGPRVDTGSLSFQMSHLAKQLPDHLVTAPRAPGTIPGVGTHA